MPQLASPHQVEQALLKVRDQASFIQRLLIDTLNWSVREDVERIEDISFGWTQAELRAEGLDLQVIDGNVWQLQRFNGNQPWGIFLLEFQRPDAFVTGRGMVGPLRKVLRGLVPSRRKAPDAGSWNREHLLFICTHQYQQFRFAYFKAPPGQIAAAPLAAFGWGPDIPARTACEFNLPQLTWDAGLSPNDWVKQWSAAFDVEKVTQKFYQDYSAIFSDVEHRIGASTGLKSADDLRMFTQTLFNRLMFLRFIERKGWLEFQGRHDYLRALFSAGGLGGKSVYLSRVRPLFFQGLAADDRKGHDAFGKVPFLNGGLFEENDLDRRAKDVPDVALKPMIGSEGLFYRYNFTIEESTPLDIEVAVDPEMLGKVFEELVTGRHETGSYYTPRPIVSFMCREALKGFLSGKTAASAECVAKLVDEHAIEGLNETHAREILTALDGLKAVDPACGSGAYLLGLLHELVAIYRLLYSERLVRNPRSLYDLKLRIISHSLYGVDLDPFATNIAMLRLWLSLAVEADEPIPLPNLDFKIETGDSLLGPCEVKSKGLDFDKSLRARADHLVELKDQYMQAHGKQKKHLHDNVLHEEATIAIELRSQLGEGVIDWRIQFADVMGRNGGFDIVLANPPYVDSEQMVRAAPEYRERLTTLFAVAKGNWDLYVPFWQRCVDLLRPSGLAALITPNKWLSIAYGTALRGYLAGKLNLVADYTRFRAFTNVGVSSIVAMVAKQCDGPGMTDSSGRSFTPHWPGRGRLRIGLGRGIPRSGAGELGCRRSRC
ncbi:MAG: Eco57I restriction-modification methylase domain-containing protein, partial [Planctomycetales bacterium]|nr:Eco57I restriction-modification methylase domain-containing protein [Planctomycetales bacterium]